MEPGQERPRDPWYLPNPQTKLRLDPPVSPALLAFLWSLLLPQAAPPAQPHPQGPGALPEASVEPRIENVVLISMDVTRRDRLGFHGGTARTPRLDGLAAAGTVFEGALAPTPVTLPSHASLLTGTYPPRHGVRDNGAFRLRPDEITLAGTLAAAGFDCAGIVSAFVLDAQFGLDAGFAHYDDRFQSGLGGMLGHEERRARATTDAALGWLAAREEGPFFLFVHYFDPHHPYEPPEPFASAAVHPYDGEIAYMDSEIGRLLDALAERELVERTLVVVTADHGESLGEHGEETHGIFLYQSTMAVPLVFRGPGIAAGRRVAGEVSLVDVAPTILASLGQPIGAHVQGRSLLGVLRDGLELEPRPVYLEARTGFHSFGWAPLAAIVRDGIKYVHAPRPELYDLGRDPHERENLLESHPELAAALAAELEAWIPMLARGAGSAPGEVVLSDADRRRLEALGYTAAAPPRGAGAGRDPKDALGEFALLQRAGQAQEAGEWESALELYERVLAQNPSNFAALERSGMVLSNLGRHAQAIERLERSNLFPGLPMYSLAQAHARIGDIERALSILEEVRRRNPKFMPAHLFFAQYHEAEGRTAEALAAYRGLLANWHGEASFRARIEERVRELERELR